MGAKLSGEARRWEKALSSGEQKANKKCFPQIWESKKSIIKYNASPQRHLQITTKLFSICLSIYIFSVMTYRSKNEALEVLGFSELADKVNPFLSVKPGDYFFRFLFFLWKFHSTGNLKFSCVECGECRLCLLSLSLDFSATRNCARDERLNKDITNVTLELFYKRGESNGFHWKLFFWPVHVFLTVYKFSVLSYVY